MYSNANLYPQCIIFYLTDLFLVTFPRLSILSFHVAVSYSEYFYELVYLSFHLIQGLT